MENLDPFMYLSVYVHVYMYVCMHVYTALFIKDCQNRPAISLDSSRWNPVRWLRNVELERVQEHNLCIYLPIYPSISTSLSSLSIYLSIDLSMYVCMHR